MLEHHRSPDSGESSGLPLSAESHAAIRASLLDPANWQASLESFARATNVAVALVDAKGCLLDACYNPRPTWSLLHTKKLPTFAKCPFALEASKPCTCVADTLAGREFAVVRDRAGLVHFAVPLELGGRRLGALVAGQVFDQHADQLQIEEAAIELGLPRDEVWQVARQEHPVDQDVLRVYCELLANLGRAILTTRYNAAEGERRSDFLATIARELRSPLTPVMNALELMRLCPADRLSCARARDAASEQVGHLNRLADKLADASRMTQGRIHLCEETVDLAQVVRKVVDSFRPLIDSRDLKFSVTLPGEPIRLKADRSRLVQILSNLLDNAIKYTEDGGRIWLSGERDEHEIVLRVWDTGVGIDSALSARVFDLFIRGDCYVDRSEGGLGIGLTMVRTLVEMHGGHVACHSDGPNQGSEFVVRLPALPQSRCGEQSRRAAEGPVKSPSSRVPLTIDENRTADVVGAFLP